MPKAKRYSPTTDSPKPVNTEMRRSSISAAVPTSQSPAGECPCQTQWLRDELALTRSVLRLSASFSSIPVVDSNERTLTLRIFYQRVSALQRRQGRVRTLKGYNLNIQSGGLECPNSPYILSTKSKK